MPEPNQWLEDILGKLDRAVYSRVIQGQSALQIALTDNLGEGLNNWYERALAVLRNNIANRGTLETIHGILNCTRYASKIIWFRIAYENWTGSNYQGVLSDEENGLGLGFLTQAVRGELRNVGLGDVWPFNDETFAEYVWFLSNAQNSASRLKWGLRAAVSGAADVDRYGLVSRLLNYSEDDPWHRGQDFRSFVGWFKNGGRPNGEGAWDWKERIGRDFLNAFPRYDDANADCGYYLHWHQEGTLPPRLIFGISKVRLRNGYDRLEVILDGDNPNLTLLASLFANDGTYSIPVDETGIGAVIARGGGNNDSELYPLQRGDRPIADGVFCRAVEGARDARRDWWTRLSNEDVVSNRKRELLVVVPGHANGLQITANGAEVDWIHCGQGQYYHTVNKTAFVLSVDRRPQQDVLINIGEWGIKIAAAAPVIDYDYPGWVLPVDEGMSVCRNGVVLRVGNVDNGVAGEAIQWWVRHEGGGGWEHRGARQEIKVDDLMDEGERTTVECRIEGRHKRASVSLMRLPQQVVEYVGNGAELPEGWNVVIRSTVEFARRGYEMVDVCRVNAAGINGGPLVSFKRPLQNFTWWFESENGVGVFDQGDFGLNDPLHVEMDSYIAFPDRFIDDEMSVRIDNLKVDYTVARQMMIEYCGYRRVKIQDLVDKLYLEYEAGGANEHSIYIGDRQIASFEFRPNVPCLSRHQDGRIGVYFPNAEISARVAIFTDDVTSEMFADGTGMQSMDVEHGNVDFVEIGGFIEECRNSSPNGELFGVVVPHGEINPNRGLLGGRGVVNLSNGIEGALPVPVARSEKCWYWYLMTTGIWLDTLCNNHPYYNSRVANFRRNALAHDNPGDWWFENANGLPDGQRNESHAYADVGERRFCIIGGDLLPESWRRLVLPPAQGANALQIKLKDLVRLAMSKRGNLKLEDNGQLLHEFRLCNGNVVCGVDLLSTQPLLCQRRRPNGGIAWEWGVYLPNEIDISPVVVLYTDNPQSNYFHDGYHFGLQALTAGFHSIQDQIDQFIAERGEVYAALFSNGAVDTRIPSGMFLNREQCQLICVITRNAELPPSEWGDVFGGYSNVIGQIEGVTTMVAGTTWEHSRMWRVYKTTQRIQNPGPDWLFGEFAVGISPEGLRDSLRDLFVVGYNFLAEPELFFNLPLLLCVDNQCCQENNVGAQGGRCEAAVLRTGRCAHYFRDQPSTPVLDGGIGICSAVLAWREYQSMGFGRPTCKEADFGVDAENHDAFINFGVQATFENYPFLRNVIGAAGGRILFQNNVNMSPDDMLHAGFSGFTTEDGFKAFRQSKVQQLRTDVNRFFAPQNCDGLDDADKLNQVNALISAMLENERLTQFMREMIRQWYNAIAGIGDIPICARIVMLAGIACAVNLVVCCGGWILGGYVNNVPDNWILSRNSYYYKLLNGIVYTAYCLRHYSNHRWGLWRLMMRAHIGALGLLQSFNIHH